MGQVDEWMDAILRLFMPPLMTVVGGIMFYPCASAYLSVHHNFSSFSLCNQLFSQHMMDQFETLHTCYRHNVDVHEAIFYSPKIIFWQKYGLPNLKNFSVGYWCKVAVKIKRFKICHFVKIECLPFINLQYVNTMFWSVWSCRSSRLQFDSFTFNQRCFSDYSILLCLCPLGSEIDAPTVALDNSIM